MISLIYRFESTKSGILPFSSGYAAYGLAAGTTRGLPGDLFGHSPSSIPSYTFSSLFPLKKTEPGQKSPGLKGYPVRPGDLLGLRITFLEDHKALRLHEALSVRLAEPFPFLGAELKYTGCLLPGEHPLSRETTPDEILTLPESETLTIAFLSPTSFRVSESNMPLPHPHLVFSSLLRKWKAWELPDLGVEAGAFAGIRLGRFTLESKVFKGIKGALHFGFVGKAQFDGSNLADPSTLKAFTSLSALAFYSGIGIKTAQGMGQAIPEIPSKGTQN
jgi:CRISPR-associated endoribonuclease Cas6